MFHKINTLASQDKSQFTSLFRVKQTTGCSSSSLCLQDSCHHVTKPHCGVISLILDGSTKSMTTTPKCRNQCIDLLQKVKMVHRIIWNLHLHEKCKVILPSPTLCEPLIHKCDNRGNMSVILFYKMLGHKKYEFSYEDLTFANLQKKDEILI